MKKEVQPLVNELYLLGRVVGHTVRFLVGTVSFVFLLAANIWNGPTSIVQQQINTGDQLTVKLLVHRYPAAHREEEQKLVEDMLAIGIIQVSNAAWSSPIVLVKKKDGSTQFCIGYSRLNQASRVDAYPSQTISSSSNSPFNPRPPRAIWETMLSSSMKTTGSNCCVPLRE